MAREIETSRLPGGDPRHSNGTPMLEPIVAVGALAPPWRLALVSLTPARKYHRLGRGVAVGMALFGSSVEHTGNSEKFRKAVDMTDDELAAIVARAELTVI